MKAPIYELECTDKYYIRTYPTEQMLNGEGKGRTSIFRDWIIKKPAILIEPWELITTTVKENDLPKLNRDGSVQLAQKYVPAKSEGDFPPAALVDAIKDKLGWSSIHFLWTPLQEAKHGRMLVSKEPLSRFKSAKHASACNIPSVKVLQGGFVKVNYQ